MTTLNDVIRQLEVRAMTTAELAKSLGEADTNGVSRAIYRLREKGVVVCSAGKLTKADNFWRKRTLIYELSGKHLEIKRGGKPKKWPAYLDGVQNKKARYKALMRYKAELEACGFAVSSPAAALADE